MKNAKELLIEFLTSFGDVEKTISLFAADAVFEIPYMESIGLSAKSQGHDELRGFFSNVMTLFPDWKFSNIQVLMETPDQVFAEYEGRAHASTTERELDQLYFGRLVAENGKIKQIREALNPVKFARVIFPNGLADIRPV